VTPELLLDNSAWARLDDPSVPRDRVEEIASALEERRIAVCLPFLLEAGYSARHAAGHADLLEELLALPFLHIDETIERRAVDAQGQLARAAHHRIPPSTSSSPRSRTGTTSASSTTTPATTSFGRGPTCGSRTCGLRRAGACEERCGASRASRTPHGPQAPRRLSLLGGSANRTKNSTSGQVTGGVRHPGSSSRCPCSRCQCRSASPGLAGVRRHPPLDIRGFAS